MDEAFCLQVDGSNVGVVLLQAGEQGIDDNKFEYLETDALALIWAVQQFDVYLGPNPLAVYTDPDLRWASLLQPYHLDVRHIMGSENGVAEARSYLPEMCVCVLNHCLLLSHFS